MKKFYVCLVFLVMSFVALTFLLCLSLAFKQYEAQVYSVLFGSYGGHIMADAIVIGGLFLSTSLLTIGSAYFLMKHLHEKKNGAPPRAPRKNIPFYLKERRRRLRKLFGFFLMVIGGIQAIIVLTGVNETLLTANWSATLVKWFLPVIMIFAGYELYSKNNPYRGIYLQKI